MGGNQPSQFFEDNDWLSNPSRVSGYCTVPLPTLAFSPDLVKHLFGYLLSVRSSRVDNSNHRRPTTNTIPKMTALSIALFHGMLETRFNDLSVEMFTSPDSGMSTPSFQVPIHQSRNLLR